MQETKVIARKVSSKFFQFIADEGKTEKEFVAEVSDIPGQTDTVLSQVWNDSCDVGFKMVSERTGKECLFTMEAEMADREGEVYGWKFTASVAFNRGIIAKDIKCVIFND